MVWLGIVIGFIVGALALEWPGGIAGAFVGFIVMLAWRSRTQALARNAKAMPAGSPVPVPPPASGMSQHLESAAGVDIAQRLIAIELRLAALERHIRNASIATDTSPVAPGLAEPPLAPVAASMAAAPSMAHVEVAAMPAPAARLAGEAPPHAAPAGLVRMPDGTLTPAGDDAARTASPSPAASAPTTMPAPNPLWAWFTGGNALTRIGVIALFFGVGFLLKYMAEFITVPIEVRLLGVALAGAALVGLGLRTARLRPGYGLSLEGAGAGVLYLTTFAAFRLYDVLPATPAFVLLVAIAVAVVWLAVRANSQALAGLAIAGGFLAPFLVATSSDTPAMLFGYFAVLNAAIFALAWVRAWRALNVLGFVFTFALGAFWGERYYQPEHFATIEPFLVLFFVFYVTIAILYAKRGALEAKAPVDAILVFGVPLVGFALQAGLVGDTRYGVAWSALALAFVYAGLAGALFRRAEPGLALLARAFFVLAVIFATVAIPFAADPQSTSAWWALEAAGVYWIGCRQRQPLARGFALLLQIGAALAFALNDGGSTGTPFINASFLGAAFIALAALATAFVADRNPDAVSANERALVPWLVLWGVAWWLGGGAVEVSRLVSSRTEANAILAFAAGSVIVALGLCRVLAWPRLAWFGAALLPVMAVAAFADWDRLRTTLLAYGFLAWPLAWATQWAVLRAADGMRGGQEAPSGFVARCLPFAHALSAIALVAWTSWEASEWVGRHFPVGTVWVPCAAALPAIAYLALVVRAARFAAWPWDRYRSAYAASAGTAVAALLAVWFAIVNLISPGATAPLPYLPILNPLDLTLVAALAVLFAWAHFTMHAAERSLYAWFGAALFLLINAMVFRSVHQWLGVPWRVPALMASKPLQAALTLTWTATALPLMLLATRRAVRPLWMVGAFLLAVVVGKLFLLDLGALSGLPRVVAFLGVGMLLLLIGYLAPLPPAQASRDADPTQ